MRLLIVGATGGTGRQLVAQALERGHTVTALVRDPSRLQVEYPHVGSFIRTVRISRADVADFMLNQVTGDDYFRTAPGVCC